MLRTRRKRKTSREKIKDARKEKRETREKEEEKKSELYKKWLGIGTRDNVFTRRFGVSCMYVVAKIFERRSSFFFWTVFLGYVKVFEEAETPVGYRSGAATTE